MQKERVIDATLYDAVLYLTLLHSNGASQYEAVESLSRNAVYFGAAAAEFSQILADIDCGSSISEAFKRLETTTPSRKLRQFISGYLSAIQTTGSAIAFLDDTLLSLQEERRVRQKTYLESLSVLGEIFLVLFVAGPLFVVIAALVLGMISGVDATVVGFSLFVALPLGVLAFLILLDSLASETACPYHAIAIPEETIPCQKTEDDPDESALFHALRHAEGKQKRREVFQHPARSFAEHPALTFCLTVPLGVASLFLQLPTLYFQIVLVLLILFTPFAFFSARKEKHRRATEAAMPDFLRNTADLVSRGVSVSDAVQRAAESDKSPIQNELYRISSDIWFGSGVSAAFIRFASAMKLASVTRQAASLKETIRFAYDMPKTLRLMAADAKTAVMMEEERRSAMSTYVVVIYLGFAVFLFVMGILLTVFLPAMAMTADASAIGIGAFPVSVYEEICIWSVLVHGICSGLSAGKMGNGSVVSGVKHACILVAVGAAAMILVGMV